MLPPLLLLPFLALSATATPLTVSLTSCATKSSTNTSSALLNFSSGYAQIVRNEEGLVGPSGGTGDWLMRMNLVGESSKAVTGYDTSTEKLATLFASLSFLSSPVISSVSSLCYSLHSYPPTTLPPQDPTTCTIPAGPVSLNLSLPLTSLYPLTTLRTHVRIVDAAFPSPNELSCVDIEISPYIPEHFSYKLFLWIPVGIAAAFWAVLWGARAVAGWGAGRKKERERVGKKEGRLGRVLWTAMMSTVSGDVLVTSVGLLRFVTPGFRDIIFHLQFCSSLSMIAVLWPSFVYPIATRGAWASLIGNVTLVQSSASARFDPLSSNYAPSSASPFESEFASPSSSLYLDASAPNRLLNLDAAPGMASFAHAVGLREQDLFGTSAAIFLLICAAVVVISLTIWAIHGVGEYAMGRAERRGSHTGSPQRFEVGLGSGGGRGIGKEDEVDGVFDRKGETHQPPTAVRRQWWKFRIKGGVGAFYASSLQGNLTRILILFHLPITTFAVYQFTIYPDPASLASLVLAVFFFLFICVLIPIYLIYRLYTIPSPKLYDATRTLLSLGPLYTLYGEGSQLYAGVLLGSNIVSAAVIGGGQGSGTAQAIVLLVSEIVMSLVTSIWLPWGEGASMGATSFLLCVARIITLVLVLVLSQAVDVGTAAAAWIAYAIIVIQAVVFLLFVIILIVKVIEAITRLIVHAPFDESEEPFDTGLLGAMSKLNCCGDGLLRASGRKRKRRGGGGIPKRLKGKRAPSVGSTQLMLGGGRGDGHTISPQRSPGFNNASYSPYDPRMTGEGANDQGYFPEQLGGGGGDDRGFIMGGWRPPSVGPYGGQQQSYNSAQHLYSGNTPSHEYQSNPYNADPSIAPAPAPAQQGNVPKRGFSVVRGGRSAYETPYALVPSNQGSNSGSGSHPRNSQRTPYEPPIPLSPVKANAETPRPHNHQRTKSQTAVVEQFPLGPPTSNMINTQHAYPSTASFAQQSAYDVQPLGMMDRDDGNDSDESEKPAKKRSSWFRRGSRGGIEEDSSDSDDGVSSPVEELRGDAAAGGGGGGSRWPFGRKKGGRASEGDAMKNVRRSSDGPSPVPFASASTNNLASTATNNPLSTSPSAWPQSAPFHQKTFSVARPTTKASSADGHSNPFSSSTTTSPIPPIPTRASEDGTVAPPSSSFVVKRPNQTRKSTEASLATATNVASRPSSPLAQTTHSGSPNILPPPSGSVVTPPLSKYIVPIGPNQPAVPSGPNFAFPNLQNQQR